MRLIPQLLSAPLNPIPVVENFRRSHLQLERSDRQGILVRKYPKKCNALINELNTHVNQAVKENARMFK